MHTKYRTYKTHRSVFALTLPLLPPGLGEPALLLVIVLVPLMPRQVFSNLW